MQDTGPADLESWFSFDCAQYSKGAIMHFFVQKHASF